MKREFLMLAQNYEEGKYGIASWFASEKLDGCRAFWDGGITRGRFADEVPFANTEKDGRLLVRRRATGLWSRYGKPVHAPDWWLDKLPEGMPLDGELYTSRGGFQQVMSTVKDLVPGEGWQRVRYMVFDRPAYSQVFGDGVVNVPNYKKQFSGLLDKLLLRETPWVPVNFEQALFTLRRKLPENEVVRVHEQEQLPHATHTAVARVEEMLSEISAGGGEGVILRAPHSVWVPERVRTMLKVKPMRDAEGTVVGYTWGRRTELGSKLLGLMGALVLRLDSGVRLELSGFTEGERQMAVVPGPGQPHEPHHYSVAFEAGREHGGESVLPSMHNPSFPIGSRVSFRYRELTDAGVPKEARYWRKT